MGTIERETLITWMDFAIGLSEEQKQKLLLLNDEQLEHEYKMIYLNKEVEIEEISYMSEQEKVKNDTYRFCTQKVKIY